MIIPTVKWNIKPTVVKNAAAADHFVITLAPGLEAQEKKDSRSHRFDQGVEPGIYQGAITICAADGTELASPTLFTADLTGLPAAPVPVDVTVDVEIQ